jgi:enoyl-CoA hydratase/carnithine racemase
VRVATGGGVRIVELAREERRNAIDHDMRDRLLAAVRERPADGERLLVLRAAGRVFSAGNDLSMLNAIKDTGGSLGLSDVLVREVELLRALETSLLPSVALLDGPAYGAAVELVAACDWVIATPRAAFHWPEWQFGILPAGTSLQRLGPAFLWRALRTGLDAAAARAAGLIGELVPEDGLDAALDAVVEWVMGLSPEVYTAWRAAVLDARRPGPGPSARLSTVWAPRALVKG